MTTTEHTTDGIAIEEHTAPMAADSPQRGLNTVGDEPAGHRVRSLLYAAAGYLFVSLIVWWHVWTGNPTTVTTCGCGDTSLFTWFLEWPAYALSHGQNPLYSTALFHPTGVNLLSNTAEVGIGVVLAPVTWLFGPVATLNVALTLSPVLSALAMYVLLRRWVSWAPAAFVGGLLYGFSPFILLFLTDAHLMLTMVPFPPLVVACLDELFVRQRRSPVVTGVLLALLVWVQFFIGTEMLVLIAMAAAIGVVVTVVLNVRHIRVIGRKARYALTAMMAAAVTGGVLLAYPTWFALAGPAHLSGPIWGTNSIVSLGGTNLRDYLFPAPTSARSTTFAHRFGGYQGPALSEQYLGIGLLVVLVVGLVIWRRDLRLWLFTAVGATSVLLSFGLQNYWTLWSVVLKLPLMQNVVPSRFLIVTYLCAAVMLGLIVDHVHRSVDHRWPVTQAREAGSADAAWERPRGRPTAGAVAGVVVSLIALVPIAWYYVGSLPLTTQEVVLPRWYRTVAPHLTGRQVILAFPVPFAFLESSMTWQAVDSMSFDQIGGGGPNSIPERAGKEGPAQSVLGSLSIASTVKVTSEQVTSTRQALDGWGVTMVVVPDSASLPLYEKVYTVRSIVVLITAATGQKPIRQAGAWVWTHVDRAPSLIPVSSARLSVCSAGPQTDSVASLAASADCVLASPGARSGPAQ
jgi:hypothetical protein